MKLDRQLLKVAFQRLLLSKQNKCTLSPFETHLLQALKETKGREDRFGAGTRAASSDGGCFAYRNPRDCMGSKECANPYLEMILDSLKRV
jgi:hypothetical protein